MSALYQFLTAQVKRIAQEISNLKDPQAMAICIQLLEVLKAPLQACEMPKETAEPVFVKQRREKGLFLEAQRELLRALLGINGPILSLTEFVRMLNPNKSVTNISKTSDYQRVRSSLHRAMASLRTIMEDGLNKSSLAPEDAKLLEEINKKYPGGYNKVREAFKRETRQKKTKIKKEKPLKAEEDFP